MQVIKPFDITDATMTNTIPEPDTARGEALWNDNISDTASITEAGAADEILSIASDGSSYFILALSGASLIVYEYDSSFAFVQSISPTGTPVIVTGSKWAFTHYNGEFYIGTGQKVLKYNSSFSYQDDFDVTEITSSGVCGLCASGGVLYVFAESSGGADFGINVASYQLPSYANIGKEKIFSTFSTYPIGASVFSSQIRFAALSDSIGGDATSESLIYKYSLDFDLSNLTQISEIDADPQQSIGYAYDGSRFNIAYFTDDKVRRTPINYKVGDRVAKTATHKIYEAALATDDDPEVGVNKIPPSWTEVSATNKYKAFDYVKNLQAIGSSPLVVTLTPGKLFSALAGFNISGADNINITVNDPTDGEVYNKDIPMNDVSGIVNMWQYFFYEPSFIEQFVVDDLPPYKDATITITFTGSGDISIGELAYGRSRNVGVTVYGSSYDRKSYSNVEDDDFGNKKVTLRPSASYTSFEVSLETSTASYVEKVLKDVLDTPTLYIGDSVDGEKIIDLGYYERSALVLSNPARSEISIKVRGLV